MSICSWLGKIFDKVILASQGTSLAKKVDGVLVVIVGHGTWSGGKQDKGAASVAPLSMQEYPYNKDIVAPAMVEFGKNNGLEVVVLTKDKLSTSAVGKKASDIVTSRGKGCVIELHFNSFNYVASGTETLYRTNNSKNKEFAQACQDAMVKVFQRANRGIKLRNTGRGALNLKAVTVPCCLVEPLFGDNKTDAALLKDKSKVYAQGLVEAAIVFLGGPAPVAPVLPRPAPSTIVKSLFTNKVWESHLLSEIKKARLTDIRVDDSWFRNTDVDWLYLMAAVVKYESSFNPSTTYTEGFKNGKGEYIVSTGLFQVSYESVRGYGYLNETTESLKDPIKNLSIGVAIFKKLCVQDGTICGGGVEPWKGAARYFSTLRKYGKLDAVKARYLEQREAK